jgi:hypothetical protein
MLLHGRACAPLSGPPPGWGGRGRSGHLRPRRPLPYPPPRPAPRAASGLTESLYISCTPHLRAWAPAGGGPQGTPAARAHAPRGRRPRVGGGPPHLAQSLLRPSGMEVERPVRAKDFRYPPAVCARMLTELRHRGAPTHLPPPICAPSRADFGQATHRPIWCPAATSGPSPRPSPGGRLRLLAASSAPAVNLRGLTRPCRSSGP